MAVTKVEIFLTIVSSIVIPVLLFLLANLKPRLSCAKFSYSLGEKKKTHEMNVTLAFDFISAERITVTRFAVWNSSFREIEKEAFRNKENPIRFTVKEGEKIISGRILRQTNPDNKIELVPQTKDLETGVKAEYINRKDGFIIEIVHSGEASDISAICDLKNGKKLKTLFTNDAVYLDVNPDHVPSKSENISQKFEWVWIPLLVVLSLIWVYLAFLFTEIDMWIPLFFLLFCLSGAWFSCITVFRETGTPISFLIPQELRAYRDINNQTQTTEGDNQS